MFADVLPCSLRSIIPPTVCSPLLRLASAGRLCQPTWVSGQRKKDVEAFRQLDGGEEPDVARVSLGKAHRGRGNLQGGGVCTDGERQHHSGAGADPEQVLARQEGGDAQASGLVLADDGVRPCESQESKQGVLRPGTDLGEAKIFKL